MLSNLYTESDIENLSGENIKEIRNIKNNISEGTRVLVKDFTKEYIINNLESLLAIEEISQAIEENIFAIKGAIKWYRFNYDSEFTQENLINTLRSLPNYGNDLLSKDSNDIDKNSIISICEKNNTFILKVLISEGYRTVNNGLKSRQEDILKSVIVILDCENRWIEVRANEKAACRVLDVLKRFTNIQMIFAIRVLNKYDGIESFKNDLNEGFLLDSSSIPAQDIELSREDGVMIKNTFEAVDDYLENKDIDELKNSLDKIYFGDGVSFREIMLAGLDAFNIKVKNDSPEDISKQAFYAIFKDFLIQDSNFLVFTDKNTNHKYTIQVGINSNSITFRSKPTETIIEYIRNKIV